MKKMAVIISVVAFAVVFAFAGCQKSETPKPAEQSAPTVSSAPSSTAAPAAPAAPEKK